MTGRTFCVFQFEMRDQRGVAWCRCGLPKGNKVHRVPDPPPDSASKAAGEQDDEGDE